MLKKIFSLIGFMVFSQSYAQLWVARDTITVMESGKCLKMPWANGINFANVSNIDLNLDGKMDVVAFDKLNQFNIGRFRCFINNGLPGQTIYTAAPQLAEKFPVVSGWAIFRDYNCDGKQDIFCSTSAGIMVYRNTSTLAGGLSFTLAKSLIYSDFQGTNANLYAASNGVPAIDDIDGDGDLDILTFSPQGVFVEYHKNLSKEDFSNCDSLKYQLATNCWGQIIESGCAITMNYTCSFKPIPSEVVAYMKDSRHAGSCLTCLDSDGDGDQDLIAGDIGCSLVQYAHNTGSSSLALISDTTKLYPNYPLKANTAPTIKINNFPCAYYVDIDGDNKKDLVATPNTNGSENSQSVWYYRNASLTNTVDFQFVKKNLFQDEMIEVGQNSFPILFDYNADGKKDLLIGTFGYYVPVTLHARLTLYENKGTNAQPSFSLISRDYAGVGSYSLNALMPAAGDIDGDGDTDLLLGTLPGQIHWLENTAGAGQPCNFSVFKNNPFGFTTPSAAAAPQIFDMDKDGLPDLMIGGKHGRIMFYRNVGTAASPSFSLISNFFGNVDVKGPPTSYGTDGYAVPYFYEDAGNTKLLVGSVTGQIYHYAVPSHTSACVLLEPFTNSINEGGQSAPLFEDINNDGKRDLFVGNAGGGLSFFSSMGPDVSVPERSTSGLSLSVFPNPASGMLHVKIDGGEVHSGNVIIKDMLGKTMKEQKLETDFATINVENLSAGVYFVIVDAGSGNDQFRTARKVVIE